MSGVRGSGVEGGLRGVPGRRPAKKKKKKKTTTTIIFIQSRRKVEKGPKSNGFITFCIPLNPRSSAQTGNGPKSTTSGTFCIPLNPASWSHFRQYGKNFRRLRRAILASSYVATVSALASLAPRVIESGRHRLGARFARAHAHPPPRPRAPTLARPHAPAPIPPPRFLPTSLDGSKIYFHRSGRGVAEKKNIICGHK